MRLWGWRCDILPAGSLEFIIGPEKGEPTWGLPILPLPAAQAQAQAQAQAAHSFLAVPYGGSALEDIADPARYARKVSVNAIGMMRRAAIGERNATLNLAAFKMARLGEHVAVELWERLAATPRTAVLEADEVRETIESARAGVARRPLRKLAMR